MSPYFGIIEEAIDHIDAHITEPLRLGEIAARHHVSEYFFARMFSVVVGQSPKKYILGRRLTKALERLRLTEAPIIDIALETGFDYPEVFSRAFKRQFGISPSAYRKDRPSLDGVEKARVISRNLINFQGALTLNAEFVTREAQWLEGINVETDVSDPSFTETMTAVAKGFVRAAGDFPHLHHGELYNLVKCLGDGSDRYQVFFGQCCEGDSWAPNFVRRFVPGGSYAVLSYSGKMGDVREIFTDDLLHWIVLKEIELRCDEFSMMVIYDKLYVEEEQLKIYIPVTDPKTEQEVS